MAKMTDLEIEELLSSAVIGVLATVDACGRPEGTPVWFAYAGDTLRILVDHDSRKARNIAGNENVCLTVDTREPPYRGVILRGTATVSGPDPKLREALAIRYLGEETGKGYLERTRELDEGDALVTMTVTSRYSWDYSKGL